jgi:peptide/nickel transport system permease protein
VRLAGRLLLAAWVVVVVLAPWIAPYSATTQFPDRPLAPPTSVHVFDADGLARPYLHRVTLADPLTRRYVADPASRVALQGPSPAHLFGTSDPAVPVLLLGADGVGRDVFSRLVLGARTSLTIACCASLCALALGLVVGVASGYHGGAIDGVLMRTTDLVVVLPALYVVLALRGALPLVLSPAETATFIGAVLALVGWPMTARGVRAVVAAERGRDYVAAANAAGAGGVRIMVRHLSPAAFGFARTQAALLVPMFVIAEATLSYAGLGLPDAAPGWGTMLVEAGNLGAIAGSPWLLAPAAALFTLVLAINLTFEPTARRVERHLHAAHPAGDAERAVPIRTL